MILFLLFSIPLTYLFVNNFFNNHNIKKRAIALPFIYGMVLSIPILLFYWSFLKYFVNSWSAVRLYFYYFFNKDGIVGLYSIAVIMCIFLFIKKPSKAKIMREITAFIMGLYFSIAVYDTLAAEAWYGSLELFIIPILRISSIFLISILITRSLKSIDWWRYIWMGLAVVVPLFMTFIPVMFVSNQSVFSVVSSLLILVVSSVLYVFEVKGRLIF